MCSKKDKLYPIEFFLNFDYVGAPWDGGQSFGGLTVWSGNGGFSLRNVSLSIFCLENSERLDGVPPNIPEDFYFAYCAQVFGRPAPFQMAKYFALETTNVVAALGIHGICTYASQYGCEKKWVDHWLSVCPESSFLFPDGGRCRDCLWYDMVFKYI